MLFGQYKERVWPELDTSSPHIPLQAELNIGDAYEIGWYGSLIQKGWRLTYHTARWPLRDDELPRGWWVRWPGLASAVLVSDGWWSIKWIGTDGEIREGEFSTPEFTSEAFVISK